MVLSSDEVRYKVAKTNPMKRGLKRLFGTHHLSPNVLVAKTNPMKRGLKVINWIFTLK